MRRSIVFLLFLSLVVASCGGPSPADLEATSTAIAEEPLFSLTNGGKGIMKGNEIILTPGMVKVNCDKLTEGYPPPPYAITSFTMMKYVSDEYFGTILVVVGKATNPDPELSPANVLFAFYPNRTQNNVETIYVQIGATFSYLDFPGQCIVIVSGSDYEESSAAITFRRTVDNGVTCFNYGQFYTFYSL